MNRMVTRTAMLSLVAVILAAPAAHAGTRVFVQIGAPAPIVAPVVVAPPVAVAPAPYGLVWRPAYYMWTGYGYQLVPAGWVRPPFAGAMWVPGRWASRPHGSIWAQGYWRHR